MLHLFQPVNSIIEPIPLCLIRPVPLCLMSIEERSLDRDGSLPHPICSCALLCFPPAVGGPISRYAPWADAGCSDEAVGRSPSSCRQSSPSSPQHQHSSLSLLSLFYFHSPPSVRTWIFSFSFWIRTVVLRGCLLACSAIAGGGDIISSVFLRAKLWGSDLPLKSRFVFWSRKL